MTTLEFLQRETASLAFTGRLGQHYERRKHLRELSLQGGDVGGEILFGAPHSTGKLCATRLKGVDKFKQIRTNSDKRAQDAASAIDEALFEQIGEGDLQGRQARPLVMAKALVHLVQQVFLLGPAVAFTPQRPHLAHDDPRLAADTLGPHRRQLLRRLFCWLLLCGTDDRPYPVHVSAAQEEIVAS